VHSEAKKSAVVSRSGNLSGVVNGRREATHTAEAEGEGERKWLGLK